MNDAAVKQAAGRRGATELSGRDSARFLVRMVLPLWFEGVLLRRRGAMAVAQHWDFNAGAVRFMQQLRHRHGEAPAAIRKPGRTQLLLLSATDAAELLRRTPVPFTPASAAKRAALSHFEPHGSLISRGGEREARRHLNDAVLQSAKPVHDLARRFAGIVREEASRLLGGLAPGDELTWAAFTEAWYCAVRRIVLGERARDDRELTEMLARLRAAANWVYVLPARRTLRARYHARLNAYLARAEPGSLAAMIAAVNDPNAAPADQVTQWLFAFDGAGIGVFRALALLLTHAEAARPAAAEIEGWKAGHPDLPFLRASFVEALRLWPTTPAILREAAQDTSLGGASVQQGTGIIVYAPFFHRDNERLTNADRFDPNQWLYKDPAAAAPFVPFSAGPAACPGRHLASLIAGGWLAALLDGERLAVIAPADVRPDAPLPGTLDHFSIRFRVLR